MATTTRRRRTSAFGLAFEAPRAAGELTRFAWAMPGLRDAPHGDGHPVLVLPGFIASDVSTRPLRWFLRDLGYQAHGWRLGRNLGPSDEVIDGLRDRVVELVERHDTRMSIIGWSLGGIYAREIARTAPEVVRSVITLGSPFRLQSARRTGVGTVYGSVSAGHSDRTHDFDVGVRSAPIPVPVTAIYSRTDGIVPWRACLEDEGPVSENVEVRGSHSGLGHNPEVLRVIADRLAQPDHRWRRYAPADPDPRVRPARSR